MSCICRPFAMLVAGAVLLSLPHVSFAQTTNTSYLRNFVSNRPTTSPYLALVQSPIDQLNSRGAARLSNTYLNRVRPRLEERQAAVQQQRQLDHMRRQLSQVQADVRKAQEQGSFGVTGHPTRFMQYYHYYPGFLTARGR